MKRTPTEAEKKAVLDAVFTPLEGKPPARSSELLESLAAGWERTSKVQFKRVKETAGATADCHLNQAIAFDICIRELRALIKRLSNVPVSESAATAKTPGKRDE